MTKTFLIGQLERFGDCLYATALAKQIKKDYPQSRLTWAVLSKYKSILELNPDVDEIWEITPDGEDYYGAVWQDFEAEALRRKREGEFDEIFFSQISPKNWLRYNGTIRGTILSAYRKPITVSVTPVVRLSATEVERVTDFAEKHKLRDFEHVVLFENAPGSGQSKVNTEFALNVAAKIAKDNPRICFILTSPQKLQTGSANIIDAGELTFKENAELTKYCTLLIGCSSGITWLSTSDWAKPLPTIQLLNKELSIFAGMHYDFEINRFDTSRIIEMVDFDEQSVVGCVESALKNGVEKTKKDFHQVYKPGYFDLQSVTEALIGAEKSLREIFGFIRNYVRVNNKFGNKIDRRYLSLYRHAFNYSVGRFYERRIRSAEKGFFFHLRKFAKTVLWKK